MGLATNQMMMRTGLELERNDHTKYVVCTNAGVLGFYSNNSSRHIKKTVLAFRYPMQAQTLANTIKNSTGVEVWVEKRMNDDILDEKKRKERARKRYVKGKVKED